MMTDLLNRIRNSDGIPVGCHCITYRNFCRSTALLMFTLGLCLVSSIACALTIRIPKTVDPVKLTIIFGSYAYGLAVGNVATKSGVYDYQVDLKGARAKLLMYCPGFKTVFVEFQKGDTTEVYEPVFERIPMVPVRIRLTYFNGKPFANKQAQVYLWLLSHEYFGYLDGMMYGTDIISAVTDSKGEFVTQIPSLLDDPYFTKYNRGGVFFDVGLYSHGQGLILSEKLAAKRSYPGTTVIELIRNATVHGQVRQSFLKRNNIQAAGDEVTFFAFSGRSGTGYTPGADGMFTINLKPGVYDLCIEVRGSGKDGKFRSIPIQKHVTLKDNEDHYIDIK